MKTIAHIIHILTGPVLLTVFADEFHQTKEK